MLFAALEPLWRGWGVQKAQTDFNILTFLTIWGHFVHFDAFLVGFGGFAQQFSGGFGAIIWSIFRNRGGGRVGPPSKNLDTAQISEKSWELPNF